MAREVIKFIMEQLLKLLPIPKLPDGVAAALPIINEFAQSKLVLTDDVRADIQLKLIRALRKAGLPTYSTGEDDEEESS